MTDSFWMPPALPGEDPEKVEKFARILGGGLGSEEEEALRLLRAKEETDAKEEERKASAPPPPPLLDVLLDEPAPSADKRVKEGLLFYSPPLCSVPLALAIDPRDLLAAAREAYPWMAAITLRVAAQLAASRAGDGVLRMRPMLLVGEPGCGKTSFASWLAEALGTPSTLTSMGGSHSAMDLTGSSRGWTSGQPSLAARLIATRRKSNPVIILDEIDKAGGSGENGDPLAALLGLLEPASASHWWDEYLCAPLDLSHCIYIATANSTEELPEPLLDRFAIYQVPAPHSGHLHLIAERVRQEWALRYGIDQAPRLDEERMAEAIRGGTPRRVRRAVERVMEDDMLARALYGGPRDGAKMGQGTCPEPRRERGV